MPAHDNYFPVRTGDQILWLKNYRQKVANYQVAGGYLVAEIIATQADADFCTGLLEVLQPQVTQYAQGITAYVRLILEGPPSTTLVPVPVFNIASAGTPVLPGALKRIFALIANMKKRAFCTAAVQQDLQIIGAAQPAPDPATAG